MYLREHPSVFILLTLWNMARAGYYLLMKDILTQASELMNGMYRNGADTNRPANPVHTDELLAQYEVSHEEARTALYGLQRALRAQEGERGYGSLVARLARGRMVMGEGPLGMRQIALLSLSAEDGDFRLRPGTPVNIDTPSDDLRVSDRARIVAAMWHGIEMARYTW
jgi:hypothetical protein